MKLKDAITDLRKGDLITIYFINDVVDENLDYPSFEIKDLTNYYKDAILDCVVYAIEHEGGATDIYLTGTSKDLTR
jgi:hypothetical protein